MDENLRHQRDTSIGQLDALIRRGLQIRATPSADATRAWQRDCAAAVNQLSGGTVLEADTNEIVDRILDVLMQGANSLLSMDEATAASTSPQQPRRFEFVHDAELRPVLERSFADSRDAFEGGEFALALILSSSVIDALLTDALRHAGAIGEPGHPARCSRRDEGSGSREIKQRSVYSLQSTLWHPAVCCCRYVTRRRARCSDSPGTDCVGRTWPLPSPGARSCLHSLPERDRPTRRPS